MNNSEKIYLKKLLCSKQPISKRPNRYSTIFLLLRSARKLFGCDIDTGVYKQKELNSENFNDQTYLPFQFTAIINYLIFLEQLGSIIKPKDKPKTHKKNGIFCSLKYYSHLSDEQITAIKSLRDSLTHKFSLSTEKKANRNDPIKFILSIETNSEIVKLPTTDWDGDFEDKSESSSTTIYILELVKLIEDIYTKIKNDLNSNNIELILEDGVEELKSRYTIIA